MTSVPQLARTIQSLLGATADRLARSSGFLQRERVLSGASFAQALVCGWLAAPASTLSQLAQAAATAGTPVSRQAIQQRFTPAAASFLRSLLLEALVAQGSHFSSRLLTQTALFAPDQTPLPLTTLLAASHGAQLDRAILLGGKARFPCHLLGQRLSDQDAAQRLARQAQAARAAGTPLPQTAAALRHWLLLLTSLPAEQLTLAEAFVLQRLRWQVELLFKRWQRLGLVAEWRSHQPDRILGEVYARLLVALLLHWLTAQQTRPHAYQRLATAGPAP